MRLKIYIFVALLLLQSGSAIAQDDHESLGLSKDVFEQLFSNSKTSNMNSKPRKSDEIEELRIFLLENRQGMVRGEIQTNPKKGTQEIQLMLEARGRITSFRDDGKDADLKKGDGILSAYFPMDVESQFKFLSSDLQNSVSALRGTAKVKSLQLGPRDIVPLEEGLKRISRSDKTTLSQLRSGTDFAMKLAEIDSLPAAVEKMKIDIKTTPFITFSGPENTNPLTKIRLFSLPILPIFPKASAAAVPINHDASLMITSVGVVEDPVRSFNACTNTGTAGGPWSFGHLMRELSKDSGLTPEEYVQYWLANWAIPQAPNGQPLEQPGRAAELNAKVTALWEALSPNGILNVDFFPATLNAIVNRPDLADNIGYGSTGSGGEGRFVFALSGQATGSPAGTCQAIPFTVIFEYGIDGGACSAVKTWEQRWKALDSMTIGDTAYNAALESITRDFTDFKPARKGSLNQLRTNENALNSLWQLLEFRQNHDGNLDMVTVKQTPDLSFQNSTVLQAYLAANEANILANKHVIPNRFPTMIDPFLASHADTTFGFFWEKLNNVGLNTATASDVRHKLSLNTCNGCHAGETNTIFTHIGTSFSPALGHRTPGSPVTLSGFLSGMTMTDPVDGTITRTFSDLAAREESMSNILTNSCFGLLALPVNKFVH